MGYAGHFHWIHFRFLPTNLHFPEVPYWRRATGKMTYIVCILFFNKMSTLSIAFSHRTTEIIHILINGNLYVRKYRCRYLFNSFARGISWVFPSTLKILIASPVSLCVYSLHVSRCLYWMLFRTSVLLTMIDIGRPFGFTAGILILVSVSKLKYYLTVLNIPLLTGTVNFCLYRYSYSKCLSLFLGVG